MKCLLQWLKLLLQLIMLKNVAEVVARAAQGKRGREVKKRDTEVEVGQKKKEKMLKKVAEVVARAARGKRGKAVKKRDTEVGVVQKMKGKMLKNLHVVEVQQKTMDQELVVVVIVVEVEVNQEVGMI